MPVSGRELASLDFGNLIGGPLNAVVEAQAKSAITTANFIKEVGFDKNGKVVNVDFTYNRKNDNGSDQEFTLTLPFITMLPIPYISVSKAEVEFNAKITSTTESKTDSNFSTVVNASAGGSWWFASARVQSKTSYQRSTSTTDKEERTFDMHVKVEARNVDMPAGTERILTILENAIQERTTNKLSGIALMVRSISGNTITVDGADFAAVQANSLFSFNGTQYTVSAVNTSSKTLTLTTAASALMQDKTIDVMPPASSTASTTVTVSAIAGNVITVNETITGKFVNGNTLKKGSTTYTISAVNEGTKQLTLDNVTGIAQGDTLTKG
jgi:Protein of unknown function (DUF2589).